MKRRWRSHVARWWRLGALLLALGLVSNVLVAAWIEWRAVPAVVVRSFLLEYGSGIWMMSRYESPGARTEHWFARQVVFPDTSKAERERLVAMYRGATPLLWEEGRPEIAGPMAWLARRPMTSGTSVRFQRLVGWPCKSLASTWRPKTAGLERDVEGLVIVDVAQRRPVRLPWIPVWPGFVVNTVMYAVVWGLAMMVALVPRWVRRAMRVPAGRCPKCAYDLAGMREAGCPECGWERESEKRKTKIERGGCECDVRPLWLSPARESVLPRR